MDFKDFHKDFFSSRNGAYSRVTERENYDSQITLTDSEAGMVVEYFGNENIQVGNVGSNPDLASKEFLLYPNFDSISLNLVYPKPDKPELRLYLSSRSGFKPKGGDIWFIYINLDNRIVIGSIDEPAWRTLGQIDFEDLEYQEIIENTIPEASAIDIDPKGKIITQTLSGRTRFYRDPRLAIMRFDITSYTCEIDKSHETFIAQRTRKPYVEAHHFIPIKFQTSFDYPLDNLDNIVSLCPNCHRGIHHAVTDHKLELIETIYSIRPRLIKSYSLDDIAQYYNSLKIDD
ncbi:HNH endonuclease [Maribacter sedimenticola]|uniref:HNH endonuclease n=1 Tax=Maribacter sedimenticola TaxID=228956 RepID=A0ABY1SGR1_9FLAO|nr:HNH endonuclease [Maribacter sedimenticola]SNR45661.1 HNH endonuclease [Maribacter sedimenticola]